MHLPQGLPLGQEVESHHGMLCAPVTSVASVASVASFVFPLLPVKVSGSIGKSMSENSRKKLCS